VREITPQSTKPLLVVYNERAS